MEHSSESALKEKKVPGRVSGRLRIRMRIFLGIAVALVLFGAYDVIRGEITWWLSLSAVVVGVIVGYVFGRLARVQWHPTEEKIVTRMDAAGFLIIGAYILLSIGRDYLFSQWLSGAALTAFTLTFAAGILFGRFFGMQSSIDRVLKERE